MWVEIVAGNGHEKGVSKLAMECTLKMPDSTLSMKITQ
jgi:hypothetical protein